MEKKNLNDFLQIKNNIYLKKFNKTNNQNKIKKDEIIKQIKTVMDPEIPVNIYDLGLIYSIEIDNHNNIHVDMTLTNPNCPVASSMPENVGKAIETLENINSIKINLIWEPKWTKEMMSEDAKLALDIF